MHKGLIQIPVVPPTPGPISMNRIHDDMKARFAGIIWIQKEPDMKLEDYFVAEDFWEPYSETKIYSKRAYPAAHKGVMRDYKNYLCVLESEESTEYYVVAKRVRNELEALEPYCPCITCNSSRCNPLKYVWCSHCTKCIKSGIHYASKENIERAQQRKQEEEQRKKTPGKYDKYLGMISSVKTMELVIAGVVTMIGFYWLAF